MQVPGARAVVVTLLPHSPDELMQPIQALPSLAFAPCQQILNGLQLGSNLRVLLWRGDGDRAGRGRAVRRRAAIKRTAQAPRRLAAGGWGRVVWWGGEGERAGRGRSVRGRAAIKRTAHALRGRAHRREVIV